MLAYNIGVVAYSPMQAGPLTSQFSRRLAALGGRPPPRMPAVSGPPLQSELVEGLRKIACRHGRTIAQLAIS
jgi:aryl-alcohol dehydrogenase-like predicted oxidoreductase